MYRYTRRDGRDVWYSDYKEPLQDSPTGFGKIGAIGKSLDGRLECHYCGEFFNNLGAHAAKAHKVPAKQYKDELGLLRGSALVSEQTRQLNSAVMLRRRLTGEIVSPSLEVRRRVASLGGLAGGSGTRKPEALNKTGRCYDQVLATAKSILRKHGRVTESRLRARGIQTRTVAMYFGSWSEFLHAVGDTPIRRSGLHWTDGQLITALRSLAQEIGHTPTVSDQRRYGIPSRHTYEDHFGSWHEALRRAGIQPLIPGQWARREVTDQEQLAVLSGYATSGTMVRAAKAAGISWQRATVILGRYGIQPLPQDSPHRHEQMAVAATIARRIAGWPDEEAPQAA